MLSRQGKRFTGHRPGLPRPAFLDARDDPWSYGDRIAWQELPLTGNEVTVDLLWPLTDALRPADQPAQPVHGDLLGDVMFAAGMAPAVIDWPPYYRPPSWALAVALVDAIALVPSSRVVDRTTCSPLLASDASQGLDIPDRHR